MIRRGRIIALDTPLGLRRSALKGDVVHVESGDLTPEAIHRLMQHEIVKDVRPVSRTEIRVNVADAGQAIPVLMEALTADACTIDRIEEYKPSFDEVFIELMRRDAAQRGEDEDRAETD